jgi:hypothetical protein
MKFKKNNKFKYGQDHRQFCGIPDEIDFKVKEFSQKGMVVLTAFGYGQLEPHTDKSYGNGSLFVHGLTDKQIKEFIKKSA